MGKASNRKWRQRAMRYIMAAKKRREMLAATYFNHHRFQRAVDRFTKGSSL